MIDFFKKKSKDAVLIIIGFFTRIKSNKATVLMYHSVADNPAFFNVRPKDFSRHLNFLKNNKYEIIKLSQLIQDLKDKKPVSKKASLTFDDGYLDNYHYVFPLLKKYNFPASVFISTGFIGGKMTTSDGVSIDMMNEGQIKEMEASGLVEFLPHGVSHKNLDTLSFDDFKKEIAESFGQLSKIVNNSWKIFAYPRGRFSNSIVEYLKMDKWLGAVTVNVGLVSDEDDLFTLNRNSIDSSTSMIQFKSKVSGLIGKYERFKSAAKNFLLWKKTKK